jgi:hypothetical protein
VKLFKTVLFPFSFLVILVTGCSTVKHLPESSAPNLQKSSDYTVIAYIHGDGDYLFHDKEGNPLQADENALKKIRNTAQTAKNGEYIIFHQQKKKELFWVIPLRNNKAYHYKNGELINLLSYRSASNDESFFETESQIFQSLKEPGSVNIEKAFFFYFGHEIPLFPEQGYHTSRPEGNVHTSSFSKGVQSFLSEEYSFDLVALSTCNNGTPSMIYHLQDVADVVLASPQNLHLSHLDTDALSLLNSDPYIPTSQLADSLAKSTFERLTQSVHTAVTLSVYDLTDISLHLKNLHIQYENYLGQDNPNLHLDNTDCFKLPYFESALEAEREDVHVLFRPARFGRDANVRYHSGWGCKEIP